MLRNRQQSLGLVENTDNSGVNSRSSDSMQPEYRRDKSGVQGSSWTLSSWPPSNGVHPPQSVGLGHPLESPPVFAGFVRAKDCIPKTIRGARLGTFVQMYWGVNGAGSCTEPS